MHMRMPMRMPMHLVALELEPPREGHRARRHAGQRERLSPSACQLVVRQRKCRGVRRRLLATLGQRVCEGGVEVADLCGEQS